MKKLVLIVSFAFGVNAFGQAARKTAKSPTSFVPTGYVVVEEIKGDLNKDGQSDCILIIKRRDKGKVTRNENGEEVDRNRRGILIAFKKQNQYELILENKKCFSSENEEGGNYFPPEISVRINNGAIRIHFGHGRYGYWLYNFRYRNSDFELIGYESSQNRGPTVEKTISINFITSKMKIRDNVHPDSDEGKEVFKESWKKFSQPKLHKLREIADFDNFNVEILTGLAH